MDNGSLPLVSLLIPTYNRAKWIGQAIESALQQDYPNLEIIINDDCSTDNSDEIIRKYTHDPRIRYLKNEKNLGVIDNFNKLFFELAKGEWVTLLGSDDYLIHSQFISDAVKITDSYENIALVFGKTNVINEVTKEIKPAGTTARFDIEFRKGEEAFLDFADNPYYSSGAVLYSIRHLVENNIRLTGRMTADVEMNLQLMLAGNVGYIDKVCYTVRQHDHNASIGFKDVNGLENSYLELTRFLFEKAARVVKNKNLLTGWYRKVILRNMQLCINMVLGKKDRQQTSSFHQILRTKYRREYTWLALKNPKYPVKMILS